MGLWTPFQPSEVLNLRSFTYDSKTDKIMQEQLKKVPTTEGIPILVVTHVPITRDVRENPIVTAIADTSFMSMLMKTTFGGYASKIKSKKKKSGNLKEIFDR
jgi:hypothetical protein